MSRSIGKFIAAPDWAVLIEIFLLSFSLFVSILLFLWIAKVKEKTSLTLRSMIDYDSEEISFSLSLRLVLSPIAGLVWSFAKPRSLLKADDNKVGAVKSPNYLRHLFWRYFAAASFWKKENWSNGYYTILYSAKPAFIIFLFLPLGIPSIWCLCDECIFDFSFFFRHFLQKCKTVLLIWFDWLSVPRIKKN